MTLESSYMFRHLKTWTQVRRRFVETESIPVLRHIMCLPHSCGVLRALTYLLPELVSGTLVKKKRTGLCNATFETLLRQITRPKSRHVLTCHVFCFAWNVKKFHTEEVDSCHAERTRKTSCAPSGQKDIEINGRKMNHSNALQNSKSKKTNFACNE